MKVPDKFPPGCEFFERESGSLAVVFPDGKVFNASGDTLVPFEYWPPLAEPMRLSESEFREALAA